MKDNKVAFITGANRGLGFQTALELGEKGITVIIGARDKVKDEEAIQKLKAKGIDAVLLVCDVDKFDDHKKVYEFIDKTYGKLDILINNAGIMLENAHGANQTSKISQEVLKKTFDSNFFNLVALTQVLLPLIRKASTGRIVNLSSVLGSLTLHSDPNSDTYGFKSLAYDSSKAALNAFTIHLAHELKGTKIKVNSAHPGWVKTDMGGSEAPMEIEEGAQTSVRLALLPDDGPTGGFFHMEDPLPW